MDPDGVDSSSARKRQKVGDMAGNLSAKKHWRNDGRDYHQEGYQEQAYSDYTRKGYGNEQYSSAQKYPQRETGDRYYSRDNYASNPEGDANAWKARSASPWYDEYNTSGYAASSNWNNSSSSGGGRYRGDYAADPYYSTAEGSFGRANTRQDGYGYNSGAYRGSSSNLDRAEGLPSASTSAYYRADGYASSRYNYDYSNAYHERFDERGYGPDTTTPVANRYGTAARGGRYGFGNAFRAGNAAAGGVTGKYATNFKTRQYSFGAKKTNFVRNNVKNNANKNASGNSEEAQAEEKEPEKPKLITDQSVKDFLTLRTNLLDFHLTMALLKLSLKPDLELRQTLIANTIAAPPPVSAPVPAPAPAAEAPKEIAAVAVESVPALIRTTSGVDARISGYNKNMQAQQALGPNAPLMRATSFNPAGHANDVVTPQMKRAASAQFGRNTDYNNSNNNNNNNSHFPHHNTVPGREDAPRPELVRRDSAHKEKPVLLNRFDTPEVPGRQSSFAHPRDTDSASFPVPSATEQTIGTPRADAARDNREDSLARSGRELSRERSSARSASRPRGYDESAVPSGSRSFGAPPLYRETSAGGLPRGNVARGNSRERPAVGGVAGYRANQTAAGGAQNQGQGYERGRSREPQRDSYGYSTHHQQQQGYYNYPAGGGYSDSQQYGGYDDRYGYADGYGYDDRGYSYQRGSGSGGGGYGGGYEQPTTLRRDHSRERPPGGDAYASGAYAGRYNAASATSSGHDASLNKASGGRAGTYPDQRTGGADGGFARQPIDSAGSAPGRRGRSPSRSQADRRHPVTHQTQTQQGNRTVPPTHSSNEGPGSAAKQALAKLETHIQQQLPPPETGKRSRSPSAAPQSFQSIHSSSDSLHAVSRSKNQSPEPGQVEEDIHSPPQQQQVQYQPNETIQGQDGGFRAPHNRKVINKNFNSNQHQQPQQASQQGQVRSQKNFYQNQGQGQGQGQGQFQQNMYQNQGKIQQPNNGANFHGNNKFQKNQNKFQQKGNAPGSAHSNQQQVGTGASAAANVKSPVKKLAPGEAPPLRTPR